MRSNGYTILGYAVWKAGRWYVRRTYLSRLPSTRTAAVGGLAALSVAGAVALAVRRATGA